MPPRPTPCERAPAGPYGTGLISWHLAEGALADSAAAVAGTVARDDEMPRLAEFTGFG